MPTSTEQRNPLNSPEFRKAEQSDVATIAAIAKGAIVKMHEAGIDQWDSVYPTTNDFDEDRNNGNLYVLSVSQQVLGCIVIDKTPSPEYQLIPWQFDEPYIFHRLIVDPEQQGKGFAKEILRHAESKVRELKGKSIRLDAFAKNPHACRLYRSCGYLNRGTIQLRKGTFYCFEKQITT